MDGSKFDLLDVVLSSAVYTTVHIFIGIGCGVYYRIREDYSIEGRGWFWSTLLIAILGIAYYIFLAYIA